MFKLLPDSLILASGSPRRLDLLKSVGIVPAISPASVDESVPPALDFKEAVMFLALKKALAKEQELLNSETSQKIILAADTVVAFKGKILGKPESFEDAVNMLSMLRNKDHHVATGVAILESGTTNRHIFVSTSKVTFGNYSDEDILSYVKTGEPMDKAGSYAIQGSWKKHILSYTGDYNNIVGLPIDDVLSMFDLSKFNAE